ncbi:MAG: GntR family transcriptional regulator [Candidatus Lindowbacteria bacterium]|nr:GntR family transcriptional regulator [Candidatus Lindowbacteria bacterium]
MIINVDSTDGVPLYLQIAQELKHSLAVGSLKPGEQLPSVREVAEQITVNPNTVAKAYRELELQGIVETRRGTGTFVAKNVPAVSQEERSRIVARLIDKALDEARHLQLSEEQLERLIANRIASFKKPRKEHATTGSTGQSR